MGSPFEKKNAVLTRKLNNVIYELMVKTNSDMVYVSDDVTLTEKLSDFFDRLLSEETKRQGLQRAFCKLMAGAPETFNTLKEIWDYVNINGDPESELIKLIQSKEPSVEGKGLSTHDFTDVLYEKLVNGYSREQLDRKFNEILEQQYGLNNRVTKLEHTPNIPVTADQPEDLKQNDCYFKIV